MRPMQHISSAVMLRGITVRSRDTFTAPTCRTRRGKSIAKSHLVVGMRGPLAPPEMCNGLLVPIIAFDQLYMFDRASLIASIPRPERVAAERIQGGSGRGVRPHHANDRQCGRNRRASGAQLSDSALSGDLCGSGPSAGPQLFADCGRSASVNVERGAQYRRGDLLVHRSRNRRRRETISEGRRVSRNSSPKYGI